MKAAIPEGWRIFVPNSGFVAVVLLYLTWHYGLPIVMEEWPNLFPTKLRALGGVIVALWAGWAALVAVGVAFYGLFVGVRRLTQRP